MYAVLMLLIGSFWSQSITSFHSLIHNILDNNMSRAPCQVNMPDLCGIMCDYLNRNHDQAHPTPMLNIKYSYFIINGP